jgi:rhodanese-related sulfurtransferase
MKCPRAAYWGAALLLLASGALALYGQPDIERKWQYLAGEYGVKLEDRSVYIDPAELLSLMQDDYIQLLIVDVRPEPDWNLFHLRYAERIAIEELPQHRARLASLPANAVVVVVSNGEALSTKAWKHLMVLAKTNAYILEGGLNHWLDIYRQRKETPGEDGEADGSRGVEGDGERLRHTFKLALGDRHPPSFPDPHHVQPREYEPKVKLIKKVVKKGGCG